jgi:hypothetical protein
MNEKKSMLPSELRNRKGWRIWNRKMKRWWGEWYKSYPEKLLDELNGLKRPEEITRLTQVLKTEE